MHTMLDNFCWKTFLKRNFCCYLQKLPLVNGNYTRCHWLLVPVGSKFLYTKLHRLSNGIFCWMHSFKKLCWKPWFMWCLLLLYVRIPIQQILHVLLTLDYEFVNYLVNWFLYLGCDIIGWFMSPGEVHRYINISIAGSEQLCIEKLCCWLIWDVRMNFALYTKEIKYQATSLKWPTYVPSAELSLWFSRNCSQVITSHVQL